MPKISEIRIFFWPPFIGCMNDINLVSKSLNRNIAYHNILWYRPPDIVSRYWHPLKGPCQEKTLYHRKKVQFFLQGQTKAGTAIFVACTRVFNSYWCGS